MIKNWTDRDWYWLVSYLFFIIVILIANHYLSWETNLSIIANATSIALAVIAIFLSLKQDTDSRHISESMRQDLSNQINNVTMLLATKQELFEEVADDVQKSVSIDMKTGTTKESYSYDDLVKYGEKIKIETIESFKNQYNHKLKEDYLNAILKSQLIKGEKLEDEIRKVLTLYPEATTEGIINELRKKGFSASRESIRKARTEIPQSK